MFSLLVDAIAASWKRAYVSHTVFLMIPIHLRRLMSRLQTYTRTTGGSIRSGFEKLWKRAGMTERQFWAYRHVLRLLRGDEETVLHFTSLAECRA